MRPSFPELMHGLFWLVLALVALFVGLHAISVLDGIARRQQQSAHHHEKIIALADKALTDHTRFLQEHDALLGRLPGGR